MILGIEHFLYVFYTFQVIRLIINDDMILLARKIFEFMMVIYILGTAVKFLEGIFKGHEFNKDNVWYLLASPRRRI